MYDWTGRVVVITGASSGIGAIVARKAAQRGAIPIMLARSADKLQALAAELGGRAEAMQADVTKTEEIERAMEAIVRKHGRIDVLVNNAGYGEFALLAEAKLESFADMMDVNYMGTVRCIKAVLPAMMKAGSGHIVNVASMAGKIGSPKSSGYSATKHAVLGLTNCLRSELVGTGIRVSAVNPGPVDTPFFDRADPSGGYVERVRWFMLKPEKVAEELLRVVERRKAEVNLPWTAAAGVKLYQLFPRLFDRVAGKLLNQK